MKREGFSLRLLIGLRARIWLLMLVLLLPALTYITITSTQERNRARAQAQADLLALARLAGRGQQETLDDVRRTLALVATLGSVQNAAQGGDPAACATRLAEAAALYPQIVGLRLWNLNGDNLCGDKPLTTPARAADQLWFRQVLTTHAFSMGDFEVDSNGGQPTVGYGYPVTGSNGQLLAVVSASLDLDHLTQSASTLPLPPDTLVMVLNHNGLILASNLDPKTWVGKALPDGAAFEAALTAGSDVFERRGVDGVLRLYAITPILGPAGATVGLSLSRPTSSVYGPADAALTNSLAIAGGLALLALTLAGLWGRQTLVRPMQSLLYATDRLAHGDLTARARPEPAGSEVDRLAAAFNAMAASLQQREADHHKAEASLRESEDRFRVLANMAPNMIWTAAPDGAITYANARWFEYVGVRPEDNARSWPELVLHPDDYGRYLARWNQALREGADYEIEVRHRRHDGCYRWFLTRAVPVRDAQGAITAWFGTTTDIHERRLAEDRAARLQSVTAALSRAVAPAQVVDVIVTQGASALGAIAGMLTLLSADGKWLELAGARNIPAEFHPPFEHLPLEAPILAAEAARRGVPIWIATASDYRVRYPQLAHLADALGFESVAAIPLHYEGRTLGVLSISFAEARVFSPENQSFILALAQHCTQALERARLYDAERQARQGAERATRSAQQAHARAAQLETVTAGLSRALTATEVMDVILRQGAGAVGAVAATLLLVSEDGVWLERAASVGYPDHMGQLFPKYPVSSPLPAADVVRTGEAVWLESAAAYRARYPQLAEVINSIDYEAAVAVPLRYSGRIIGVLALSFPTTLPSTSDMQSYVYTLAGYCAHALERARLYDETERLNSALETRVQHRTAQLEQSMGQLRDLAARLQTVREEERRLLARELHDELGSTLTALKMAVAMIQRNGSAHDSNLTAELAGLSQSIDGAVQWVRRVATELRPGVLDDLGLLAALEWLVQEFQARSEIECSLIADIDEIELDPDRSMAVFRVVQESLTNVARHAKATSVVITAEETQGQLRLRIEDDGQGFDQAALPVRSLGMLGMRERVKALAGQFDIQSVPGQGTTVIVRIPLAYPPGSGVANEVR